MHPATLLRETAGNRETAESAVRVDDTGVRARRAIELGLNVLTSSTSVPDGLRGLRDVCRLDARGLRHVESLLSALGHALGVGVVDGDAYEQLTGLAKRLWEADRRPVLVLENPEASAASTLFGRLRDELWELPVSWLVVVSPGLGAALDQPPSGAFFEVAIG